MENPTFYQLRMSQAHFLEDRIARYSNFSWVYGMSRRGVFGNHSDYERFRSDVIFFGTVDVAPWILVTINSMIKTIEHPCMFEINKLNGNNVRKVDQANIKEVFCVVSKDADNYSSPLESYIEYIIPKLRVHAIWITTADIQHFKTLPRITAVGKSHENYIEEILKVIDNHCKYSLFALLFSHIRDRYKNAF